MKGSLPHPIPYQGSKRRLAPVIGGYLPENIKTFYEPFCGSSAMTIYAAHYRLSRQFVIGDTLEPIVNLLRSIIEEPCSTSARYREIWEGQKKGDVDYFNRIRERYNEGKDPIDLLYLICRCVKNSIRFNGNGKFTQSADKRRLGMNPNKMKTEIEGVSALLKGKVEYRVGDWLDTVDDATREDFIYMDPPYHGTSIGRDKRYHQQMSQTKLVEGLELLNKKSIRFALSYDGMTGNKEYGPPLPQKLGLNRLLLHAGVSTQATLSGRRADTIESLYLTPGLAKSTEGIIYRPRQFVLSL